MRSGIQSRLLLTTTLVLGISLTLAGLVLDRSVRLSTLSGAEEQLRLVIYSLMGAVETRGPAVQVPDPLPEPRLGQPESGLYAWITDGEQRLRWRSPSAVTGGVLTPALDQSLQPGEFRYQDDPPSQNGLLRLSYAVIWEDPDERVLTFHVAADWTPFRATIQAFRRNLYAGVAGVTALFVLAQVLAVRWGLRPLRTMAQEVREMEEGRRQRLSDAYPVELTGLADNLDRFVAHEERSRSRYRKAMEDLAHSLKTPLAAMRSLLTELGRSNETTAALSREIERMNRRVSHQLRRARASGATGLGVQPTAVAPVIADLKETLDKVYRDKRVECRTQAADGAVFHGDPGDLTELLGNLLDNAYKYCRRRVDISAHMHADRLVVTVGDDGPGIPADEAQRLLERGVRADETMPGQGIGLAVVRETVDLYRGALDVRRSALGGAELRIELGRAGID